MPKLPILSSKQVVRALRMAGFTKAPKRGKGSHLAFVKKDGGKGAVQTVNDYHLSRFACWQIGRGMNAAHIW